MRNRWEVNVVIPKPLDEIEEMQTEFPKGKALVSGLLAQHGPWHVLIGDILHVICSHRSPKQHVQYMNMSKQSMSETIKEVCA